MRREEIVVGGVYEGGTDERRKVVRIFRSRPAAVVFIRSDATEGYTRMAPFCSWAKRRVETPDAQS